LIYLALGAKLGRNTYTAGIICDPIFVTVGDNTILGQDSILAPHAIEGEKLGHHPIHIGNNVTVGGRVVILNDVTIGDGAIVGVGAVVTKGTRIGPREVWGGVPARLIRPAQDV
jgi:acetyltransferase-like isoleucine patch superfamily enzyme